MMYNTNLLQKNFNATILEKLEAGTFFSHYYGYEIMVKIGYNCQPPLNIMKITKVFKIEDILMTFIYIWVNIHKDTPA